MPILEAAKRILEAGTGLARPSPHELKELVRARKPNLFRFADDGETPNNPHWPLVLYRSPVRLQRGLDPAAIFEDLFAANGWTDSWRDGIYDFLHFHTHRHEVLGIAKGRTLVEFGGRRGRHVEVKAGDVIILPAGTGHRRIGAARGLLVVGAYPSRSGKYDQPRPMDVSHAEAIREVSAVPRPESDPVYGPEGPIRRHWR